MVNIILTGRFFVCDILLSFPKRQPPVEWKLSFNFVCYKTLPAMFCMFFFYDTEGISQQFRLCCLSPFFSVEDLQ